jgi:hypothetical protein
MNIQRLSLGASSRPQDAGYDPTMYQARVVGLDGNILNGWFNTSTPRSKGWHHGMIMVGPLNADGTNEAMFFIDDLTNPTLDQLVPAGENYGYNVVELNANAGATTGYYSDVNFTLVTP